MIWNTHYIKTDHAFLSASKYHWIRYSEEQLKRAWTTFKAAEEGTKLHKFAKDAIDLGIRQRDSGETLTMYINDAIGYRMSTEVLLYYSDVAFGTADAISFDEKKKMLRIHDLKTGKIKACMDQLKIYAAYFCLEYKMKPAEIKIELRIYQNDDVDICQPDPDEIAHIMSKIVTFDKLIQKIKILEG